MKKLILKLLTLLFIIMVLNTSVFGCDTNNVNFEPYMRKLNKKVKNNWITPRIKNSDSTVVLFSVNQTGKLGKIQVLQASGNKEFDKNAINAIEKTTFDPLPIEYKKENIDIQFTFASNLYSRVGYNTCCIFIKTEEEREFYKNLSEEKKNIYDKYLKIIKTKLRKQMDVPYTYLGKSVLVSFTIKDDGQISDLKLEETSGNQEYDELILKFFKQNSVPSIPEQLGLDQLKIKCKIMRTSY